MSAIPAHAVMSDREPAGSRAAAEWAQDRMRRRGGGWGSAPGNDQPIPGGERRGVVTARARVCR